MPKYPIAVTNKAEANSCTWIIRVAKSKGVEGCWQWNLNHLRCIFYFNCSCCQLSSAITTHTRCFKQEGAQARRCSLSSTSHWSWPCYSSWASAPSWTPEPQGEPDHQHEGVCCHCHCLSSSRTRAIWTCARQPWSWCTCGLIFFGWSFGVSNGFLYFLTLHGIIFEKMHRFCQATDREQTPSHLRTASATWTQGNLKYQNKKLYRTYTSSLLSRRNYWFS